MKITGIETIPIQGRAMVLKMFTDEGLIGYGEPSSFRIAPIRTPSTAGATHDARGLASYPPCSYAIAVPI